MKILMLVNWKIEYCKQILSDKQPPDYFVYGEPYWFYRYFKNRPDVEVLDISSFPWLESFEKNKIRFYIWQTLKALPKLGKYDLIVSHGMQSGVILSLWRRFFHTKAKHIVFDIGSFNSAAEEGLILKCMQFVSKSIDGLIYHTSSQIKYYKEFFPWLVGKSKYIRFGTDLSFFDSTGLEESGDKDSYIICVGYSKRDWETVVTAYKSLNMNIKLRLVGHVEERFSNVPGIEQISFIPIKELKNQIYNAKFCVLPLESFNYSYGQMTFMQQMALGKCVVAAETPSLTDYAEDGVSALFYTSCDVEDCARLIRKADQEDDLRNAIGENAKMFLRQQCNEKIMAEQIELFLGHICERKM